MSPDRRPLLLLFALVVAGVLFPFEWLGEHWSPLGDIFLELNDDSEHAVGHVILFTILGLVTLAAFPWLLRKPLLYGTLLFVLAVGQEAFQLAFKGRSLLFDDFRDVGIDVLSVALAYVLFGISSVVRRAVGDRDKTS